MGLEWTLEAVFALVFGITASTLAALALWISWKPKHSRVHHGDTPLPTWTTASAGKPYMVCRERTWFNLRDPESKEAVPSVPSMISADGWKRGLGEAPHTYTERSWSFAVGEPNAQTRPPSYVGSQ
ncbi:hypothetical protein Slin15195_G097330 [Septoria linicola]|uniref:Uncharacterized protein n=1 Tax=Septoria linicola TaxID=215465 RepID=A0A9Q9ENC1_9PEZI|nr:hypothetical protein Slin14017_G060410 [Septoria linicola]USW56414.1 hypothetical protein Slin15195_G097330 [Septoria linicola]